MNKYQTQVRHLACLAASLLAMLASGCGGGGGGEQAPAPISVVASVAPLVTAVSPRPNVTGVPINTRIITALFNKAMDPATLTPSSFTLACPSGAAQTGSVAFDTNNNVATLTLTNPLPVVTLCTATINAKDTSGAPMAANFSWSFYSDGAVPDTTAPTVTSTIHTRGQTNVPIDTKAGATFSEAMDPLTITNVNFTLIESISAAAVAGRVSYSGVNALFVPTGNLRPNTKYTVTIKGSPNGVKDVRGNLMVSDFVNSWTTGAVPDKTAPTVTSTLNANSATNVPVNTNIGATFSEVMNPLTINSLNMTVRETDTGAVIVGVVSYAGRSAVFTPLSHLSSNTRYSVNLKGGAGGVTDLVGNPMATDYTWSWTTTANADTSVPAVVMLNPADLTQNVVVNGAAHATFSKDMDPLTINTASFRMAGVNGTVTYDADNKIASFTPSVELAVSTTYILSISTAAKDLAGNSLATAKVWSITTAATRADPTLVDLGSASNLGLFSGSPGMRNSGTQTVINGDVGSNATLTTSVTGFHDAVGYVYDESPTNKGTVNGSIFSCVILAILPVIPGPSPELCPIAVQAGADVQLAYLALEAMMPSARLASNLANLSLVPGIYAASTGAFLIDGGDLTLDAQGDLNAIWVFQMPLTLTVGGALPQSIVLTGGALAKNVFWQVGGFATINAAGGGNMVGTIIAHSGASLSSAGVTAITSLQGRVFAPGASVTLVNTVINVPAP